MTHLRPLATAQRVTQTKDPATLHPGSCALSALLRLPPDPFASERDRSFLSHRKGSRRNVGAYPKTLSRGIGIGDGLVIELYVTMRRRYYMPAWEGLQILLGLTIPHLLLVHIVNTRGTRRLKKNIPQPTEMVNHRSSILLFPTVVPCGRNPPPGPPYSKLNCRYFSQDEKVFVRDRSRLDKPERNEIRCGI